MHVCCSPRCRPRLTWGRSLRSTWTKTNQHFTHWGSGAAGVMSWLSSGDLPNIKPDVKGATVC